MNRSLSVGIIALALLVGLVADGHAECVDVDKASAKQLEVLDGVGPALAKQIIAYRKSMRTKATKAKRKTWGFQNWATLMRVKGVGPQICAKNVSRVCFSGKVQQACPAAKAAKPKGKAQTSPDKKS